MSAPTDGPAAPTDRTAGPSDRAEVPIVIGEGISGT